MALADRLSPIRIVPFDLYNIKPFLNQKHPIIIPNTPEYEEYWMEQAKRCIEGFWGLDKNDKGQGGYRFMPGNLYTYINFCEILQQKPGEVEVKDSPLLRDIDWLIFYAFITCDGFSGFSDDEEFTSFRLVDKVEKGLKLTNFDLKQLRDNESKIKRKDGTYKKYIEARELLYRTYDKPLGIAYFDNPCTNFMLLSTRGAGKSYVTAAEIVTSFTFNGCRTLYDFLNKKQSTTIVVGSSVSSKTDELLEKFSSFYDLFRSDKGSYINDKNEVTAGAFWQPPSGSLSLGNTLTKRVKLEGGKGYKGKDTKIVHVSFAKNASAAVGYRARKIVCEEIGLFTNFFAVHGENNGSQKREFKVGFSIYIGTGGDIHKIKEVRQAFYAPEAFDILPYEDLFNGSGKNTALFIPCYYVKSSYRDDNGNTNIQEAFEDELLELETKRTQSSHAYQSQRISFPFIPQDMFMQDTDGKFPSDLIEQRIHEIESSDLIKNFSVGELTYTNDSNTECEWKEDVKGKLRPFLRYSDLRDPSRVGLEGAIVIYEHPVAHKPKRFHPDPLYMVFYDPVLYDDKDKLTKGVSLCSVSVFKVFDLSDPDKMQFNLVAEWIGRYDRVEKNHEVAFKLATYYGTTILAEVNNNDIKRYARMTDRYNWLEARPRLSADGKFTYKRITEDDIGYKVVPGAKPNLEAWLNELLITPIEVKERIDEGALLIEDTRMVQQMRSLMTLEQLLYYNDDDNFDCVSMMFLVALWTRQRKFKPMQYEALKKTEDDEKKLKDLLTRKRDSYIKNTAFSY